MDIPFQLAGKRRVSLWRAKNLPQQEGRISTVILFAFLAPSYFSLVFFEEPSALLVS
ncbi:hypothetical protein BDV28DRAFT_132905 [Aspergillus coremiiformis]|uniref:Uncharacterized protein n=1 Tax=Aspergillus coremiiformis TaxID=138285 RepID=A0A5N6Z780_9EURO|nr:hypothetical protein BDV28DRAFT_132905 [Aspergillus coremiiformis]